jgi:predicted O-methyltransferase YrrM
MRARTGLVGLSFLSVVAFVVVPAPAQEPAAQDSLDARVEAFLEAHRGRWRDANVPPRDGRFLHDMIVENGYTRALEIGTSTGHSTIWIAWAMSKTGGKVITLEISEHRHRQAVENLREAGLADFVDARLGDAHELVKTIEGPFDFVFSDADKGWYTQYFIDVAPKMLPGGCYTSHNIHMWGMGEYLDYLRSRPEFETTIEDDRTSGIGVTCRKRD